MNWEVFGNLLQVFGKIGQGYTEKQAADRDALALSAQGERVLSDAQREADYIQRQGARLKGKQRASAAARGVVVDAGSALDTVTETVVNTGLQAAEAMRRGMYERVRLKNQARETKRRGRMALQSSILSAAPNVFEIIPKGPKDGNA